MTEHKVKAIENYENICFKCLKETDKLKQYNLYRSDYGSKFDNFYTGAIKTEINDERLPQKILKHLEVIK